MKLKRATVARILTLSWNELNKQVVEMPAAELKQLLEAELDRPHDSRRPYVVNRLTQRYCAAHNAEVRAAVRQKAGV